MLTTLTSHIKRLGRAALAASVAMAASVALAGCDSMIFDDEGDCDPHYKVRFRSDYHLRGGDAFANEVNAVTLYVIDPATGNIVMRKTDSSEALHTEGYMMDLEGLQAGKYKLLVWAGDGHLNSPHFTMGDGEHHSSLTARINRDAANVVTNDLHPLFKDLDFEFNEREFTDGQGTHIHTVRLMKNTNDIHIVLQHLSGERVNPDDFTYEITEANGTMDFDNSIMPDDTLTYKPWRIESGMATGYVPDNLEEARFSSAIAHFTVGRLMANQKMWLTIRRAPGAAGSRSSAEPGAIVARVPVVDYSLMVKGHYGQMPDQEYLDRQDDYSMVFFLDEDDRWLNASLYINSWHVVPQEYDL